MLLIVMLTRLYLWSNCLINISLLVASLHLGWDTLHLLYYFMVLGVTFYSQHSFTHLNQSATCGGTALWQEQRNLCKLLTVFCVEYAKSDKCLTFSFKSKCECCERHRYVIHFLWVRVWHMHHSVHVQISLLGRGCGELLELCARVGEGRPVAAARCRGEAPPEADGQTAGPQPIGRPAQEGHAVRIPHRKDGGQPREGLWQMHKAPHWLDKSLIVM